MIGRPRVAVTGAARRVGRAVALELARHGADLLLTCHTSCDELHATAEDAVRVASDAGYTIDVTCLTVDLNVADAVERTGRDLAALSLDGLAGLVHNASTYTPTPLGSITSEDVLTQFRVNAMAPLLLTQALAANLRRARGAVVFFSDIHALGRPRRRFTAYSMSKAAASDLVATLAIELAPEVRVNGLAPGVIAWPDDVDFEERAAYERRIPLGRPGTPEEAARLVRWLLFDASYLTGEIVRIDGGRWLR
ncbi:MAG: SDR family oxidoreductase [Phycisphaerae bacterium]|nr:SDR family oxidoreductase [Phycisphaerae bacterium]